MPPSWFTSYKVAFMTPEYTIGTKCNYEHNRLRLKPFRQDTQALLAKHYRTFYAHVD